MDFISNWYLVINGGRNEKSSQNVPLLNKNQGVPKMKKNNVSGKSSYELALQKAFADAAAGGVKSWVIAQPNAKSAGVSREEYAKQRRLYEALGEAAYLFFTEEMLSYSSIRHRLEIYGHSMDEGVSICTLIALTGDNLDQLLALSGSPIPYMIQLIKWRLDDMNEELARTQGVTIEKVINPNTGKTETVATYNQVHMTDVGWSMVADENTREDAMVRQEQDRLYFQDIDRVFDYIVHRAENPLAVLGVLGSFLDEKAVRDKYSRYAKPQTTARKRKTDNKLQTGVKTGTLAALVLDQGLTAALADVCTEAASAFSLPMDLFAKARFWKKAAALQYSADVDALSHRIAVAKQTLRGSIAKEMHSAQSDRVKAIVKI